MYKNILFLLMLAVLLSCNPGGGSGGSEGGNNSKDDDEPQSIVNIEVSYTQGTASFSSKIIYVIWIENQTKNYVQNIYTCNRVLGIGKVISGTALPYWKTHIRPVSIDSITGATDTDDFIVTGKLKNNSIKKFKIYMEVDHSYDENDWFNDQPALIYSTAEIDLDNLQPQYDFNPIGWTRNENTGSISNFIKSVTGHTSPGFADLTTDMRYIKDHADDSANPYLFGDEYIDNTPATCIVGTLSAKITIN